MKNKIILTVLILFVIILGCIFIDTLITYFKKTNELESELESTNIESTHSNDLPLNSNDTIEVDENSSIKIITEYDESMFKGKKSLVFFWASWCSHCQEEYDVVKTAITKYQNRGFNIYVVSHDHTTDELAKFMKNNDFNYEVYFDEQRVIRAHFNPEASSVPLTYIIDENAKFIASYEGAISLEELDDLINNNM